MLIVDDDPDFLAAAEASLHARGFAVERAVGGLRGVFLATQDVPDAVVCDLRMPGIDGFVVAEALRSDPATAHTAIVACTGRRDLEARAQIRSSAFDAVCFKPVDWEEVAHLLDLDHRGAPQRSGRVSRRSRHPTWLVRRRDHGEPGADAKPPLNGGAGERRVGGRAGRARPRGPRETPT